MSLIRPEQLAKSGNESGHQKAFFAFANMARWRGLETAWKWADGGEVMPLGSKDNKVLQEEVWPCLKWLHAIPNGGSRGDDERTRMIRGANLKAEGVKSGVSDMFLPFRRGDFAGLYIELKTPEGKPSSEQEEFGAFVKEQGFGFVIAYGWRDAAMNLSSYLRWPKG